MSLRTLIETARTQLPTAIGECAEAGAPAATAAATPAATASSTANPTVSPLSAGGTRGADATPATAAPGASDHVVTTTPAETAAERMFAAARYVTGVGDLDAQFDDATRSVVVTSQRASFGDADNRVTVQAREVRLGAQSGFTDATLRADAALAPHVTAHAEVFSAAANIGVFNADGSVGFNAGAGVNVASADVTYDTGGFRVQAGLSEGVGLGGSVGVRDGDGDGRRESCGSIALGPVNIGGCYEPATLLEGTFRAATAPARYALGALNAAL